MAKKKTNDSFEAKLLRIKAVADQLQREELSLDQSMALFSEADQLIKACRAFLEEASLQVEHLINPASGKMD
jgi:exodeoxyribonuclease VII small subunit